MSGFLIQDPGDPMIPSRRAAPGRAGAKRLILRVKTQSAGTRFGPEGDVRPYSVCCWSSESEFDEGISERA